MKTGTQASERDQDDDRSDVADCHALAPNRPVGRTSSTRMKMRKMPIWPSESPRKSPQRLSTTPMSSPPRSAPGIEPMPPSTTIVKATSTKALPDARIDVEGRHEQAGGDGQAGAAEAEGDGVDMGHVDADEAGAELLLGDGADRLAGVGAREQKPQKHRDQHGRPEADQAGLGEEQRAEFHDLKAVIGIDGARI